MVERSGNNPLVKLLSRSSKQRGISIDLSCATTASYSDTFEDSQSSEFYRKHQRVPSDPLEERLSTPSLLFVQEEDTTQQESPQSTRVLDLFNAEINECDKAKLPLLRRRRETDPILCYESDDEEEEDRSVAMQSRLEALRIQKELLGEDHPDVAFMQQHILRLAARSAH